MRGVVAVAHKELRQIVRDRRTLLTVLFVPAFILLIYGYALNFDLRDIRLAVNDRDGSRASRELVSSFVNSGYFQLAGYVHSPAEMDRLIDRGAVRAVLVVPAGFGRDVANRVPTRVQIVIDGDNANTAATTLGYATAITAEASASLQAAIGVERRPPPVVLEPRVWYNPDLRSTLFLVPGLIAFIAMITAVVSTALSVVREKERGTMEQIRMSPLAPASFVAGKTVPYLALSLVSSLLVLLAAMALFGLPVRGSWLLLGAAVTVFLVGALAQGLLISTLAQTQQVAFQAALLSSFLPTFILSGFVFPIASMPWAVQVITYAVPARYFLSALRAIVLKGAGIEAFAVELAAMAVFSAAMLGLASLRLAREWA